MENKQQALVRMANQIADFFSGYPNDQGVEEVRNHLRRFWDPRMRRDLVAHIDSGHGNELRGLVLQAVEKLKAAA